ncbi:MAG: YbaK/EbsC family protein [candidate division NC10 bacterium]|nr:YbaK/EbsC family protein [candidate division NC10 bacterium]MBI4414085.1 YbaK/EbsC family protein [candidate division NC10 bacterium]
MAIVKRLKEFLEKERVAYRVTPHVEAFTAQETAAAARISGKALAKVVVVKRGGTFALAVLPAACKVSPEHLRGLLGTPDVSLAKEAEFVPLFPDCDAGAMPPFGNLYGLETFVDQEVAALPEIVFRAGSHHELVAMAYADYARLAKPRVGDFCVHD